MLQRKVKPTQTEHHSCRTVGSEGVCNEVSSCVRSCCCFNTEKYQTEENEGFSLIQVCSYEELMVRWGVSIDKWLSGTPFVQYTADGLYKALQQLIMSECRAASSSIKRNKEWAGHLFHFKSPSSPSTASRCVYALGMNVLSLHSCCPQTWKESHCSRYVRHADLAWMVTWRRGGGALKAPGTERLFSH